MALPGAVIEAPAGADRKPGRSMCRIPPAEQQLTPERVRELIARECTILDDVVAYITSGVMAGRIAAVNGDDLIEAAVHNRDVSIRLARELLGGDE